MLINSIFSKLFSYQFIMSKFLARLPILTHCLLNFIIVSSLMNFITKFILIMNCAIIMIIFCFLFSLKMLCFYYC